MLKQTVCPFLWLVPLYVLSQQTFCPLRRFVALYFLCLIRFSHYTFHSVDVYSQYVDFSYRRPFVSGRPFVPYMLFPLTYCLKMFFSLYPPICSEFQHRSQELLAVSEQYQMPVLKEYCAQLIIAKISNSNWTDLLLLSDLYSAKGIYNNEVKLYLNNAQVRLYVPVALVLYILTCMLKMRNHIYVYVYIKIS